MCIFGYQPLMSILSDWTLRTANPCCIFVNSPTACSLLYKDRYGSGKARNQWAWLSNNVFVENSFTKSGSSSSSLKAKNPHHSFNSSHRFTVEEHRALVSKILAYVVCDVELSLIFPSEVVYKWLEEYGSSPSVPIGFLINSILNYVRIEK